MTDVEERLLDPSALSPGFRFPLLQSQSPTTTTPRSPSQLARPRRRRTAQFAPSLPCGEQTQAPPASVRRPSRSAPAPRAERPPSASDDESLLADCLHCPAAKRPRLSCKRAASFAPGPREQTSPPLHSPPPRQSYFYSAPLTVPTAIRFVPPGYEVTDSNIRAQLNKSAFCALCGNSYRGAEVGTLACAYHPMDSNLSALRIRPYSSLCKERGDCDVCARQFLVPAIRIGSGIAAPSAVVATGCTKIDHCESLQTLLENPLLAVPTYYSSVLALHGSGSHLTGYHLTEENGNVLMVDKPEQMAMTVQFEVPGEPGVRTRSVIGIYEEMAHVFNLGQLRESLRDARKGPVGSSITRLKQLEHPDAKRKFMLYARNNAYAEFVPFYVIARVQQSSPIKLI